MKILTTLICTLLLLPSSLCAHAQQSLEQCFGCNVHDVVVDDDEATLVVSTNTVPIINKLCAISATLILVSTKSTCGTTQTDCTTAVCQQEYVVEYKQKNMVSGGCAGIGLGLQTKRGPQSGVWVGIGDVVPLTGTTPGYWSDPAALAGSGLAAKGACGGDAYVKELQVFVNLNALSGEPDDYNVTSEPGSDNKIKFTFGCLFCVPKTQPE